MPKIQWLDLSPQLQIAMYDLFALEEWRRRSPDLPGGPWYKDFCSFKLVPFERSSCAR